MNDVLVAAAMFCLGAGVFLIGFWAGWTARAECKPPYVGPPEW